MHRRFQRRSLAQGDRAIAPPMGGLVEGASVYPHTNIWLYTQSGLAVFLTAVVSRFRADEDRSGNFAWTGPQIAAVVVCGN